MALIQQPYLEKSPFTVPFSFYSASVSGSSSNILSLGSTKNFSNDFCNYGSGVINITETGYYQVNMDFLTRSQVFINTGSFQFRLEIGSSIVAQAFVQVSSNNTVSIINDFSLQDYPFLIDASTNGNLSALFSNAASQVRFNGLGSFVSGKYLLQSGQYIRLYLAYNGVIGSPTYLLFNGKISVNKVS